MRFTTQKAALCDWLLKGNMLTIMEAFEKFGITNLPREIGRSVERAFGVVITKHRTRHTNMFGEEGSHFVYRLSGDYKSLFFVPKDRRPAHRKGLKLMHKYVEEHTKGKVKVKQDRYPPKTWPAFPPEVVQASIEIAKNAASRAIPVNRLSTKQLIEKGLKRKKK